MAGIFPGRRNNYFFYFLWGGLPRDPSPPLCWILAAHKRNSSAGHFPGPAKYCFFFYSGGFCLCGCVCVVVFWLVVCLCVVLFVCVVLYFCLFVCLFCFVSSMFLIMLCVCECVCVRVCVLV